MTIEVAKKVLDEQYCNALEINKKAGKQWLKKASQNGSIPAQVFLENISR